MSCLTFINLSVIFVIVNIFLAWIEMILYNKKTQRFLNLYFNWLLNNCLLLNLSTFMLLYSQTFLICHSIPFVLRNKEYELKNFKQTNNKGFNFIIKKKLTYFLLLSDNSTKLNWSYKPLITTLSKKPSNVHIFNYTHLKKHLYGIFNLLLLYLNKNYSFFMFNFDFLNSDIYSFSKYIYGVKNVLKYQFIFSYDLKKFRSHKWRSRIRFFIKKKRVRLVFLLDVYNGSFFVDFFKKLKLTTVGLVPQSINPSKFDFWLIADSTSYLIKYAFFSYIHSIYNLFLLRRSYYFFKKYNTQLLKLILIFNF